MIRAVLAAALLFSGAACAADLPQGFVRMSQVAPEIAQDIRYARAFNFTGAPVPGYLAGECIVTQKTAAALIAAEATLNAQGYGLILLDCYRPTDAVAHFRAWAQTKETGNDRANYFFPGKTRAELFSDGFIAKRSAHSLGTTVDASLHRTGKPVLRPTMAGTARCDAGFAQRPAESGLDMGTAFDCFSPLSAYGADIGKTAARNREILRRAMLANGFASYAQEWWHFKNARDPGNGPQNFSVR